MAETVAAGQNDLAGRLAQITETSAAGQATLAKTLKRAPRRGLQAPRRDPRQVRRQDHQDDHRPARTPRQDRRGAEEHRRAQRPGSVAPGGAVEQAGARRLRRNPAQRPGRQRAAALGIPVPGDARQRPPLRLPDRFAESAGADRHRRQVPAGELSRAQERRRRRRADGGRARLSRRHAQAYRRHIVEIHRSRGDRRIGDDVPAQRGGLRRASRQLRRGRREVLPGQGLHRIANVAMGRAEHHARRHEGRAHARPGRIHSNRGHGPSRRYLAT